MIHTDLEDDACLEENSRKIIQDPQIMSVPKDLDLLNSALDLAAEQALHNARIAGADARELAAELLYNVNWAKRVLAAAVDHNTEAVNLHRVLHLVADSAIDADDAITRNDADGLNRAISALMLNAGTAQALALAWKAA